MHALCCLGISSLGDILMGRQGERVTATQHSLYNNNGRIRQWQDTQRAMPLRLLCDIAALHDLRGSRKRSMCPPRKSTICR